MWRLAGIRAYESKTFLWEKKVPHYTLSIPRHWFYQAVWKLEYDEFYYPNSTRVNSIVKKEVMPPFGEFQDVIRDSVYLNLEGAATFIWESLKCLRDESSIPI